MTVDIGGRGIKPDMIGAKRLDHVVRLLRPPACADRHMRLAIFQPEEPRIRDIAHPQPRILHLKPRQRRQDHIGQTGQRGDDQFARHFRRRPGDPRGEVGELILCRLRDLQELLPRLGRRVAARVALKQLRAQPLLQRVDMADDGRMMNAQHLGRAADRPDPRHLIGGPHLVPVLESHSCVHPFTVQVHQIALCLSAQGSSSAQRNHPLKDP